jgi:hypothetical protein
MCRMRPRPSRPSAELPAISGSTSTPRTRNPDGPRRPVSQFVEQVAHEARLFLVGPIGQRRHRTRCRPPVAQAVSQRGARPVARLERHIVGLVTTHALRLFQPFDHRCPVETDDEMKSRLRPVTLPGGATSGADPPRFGGASVAHDATSPQPCCSAALPGRLSDVDVSLGRISSCHGPRSASYCSKSIQGLRV